MSWTNSWSVPYKLIIAHSQCNIIKLNILDKDVALELTLGDIIQLQIYNVTKSVCATTVEGCGMDASSCFASFSKITHLFKINEEE